ncbi:MAG: hypothetical protein AB8F78_09525 [Saprospiraceae bacterium]
MSNDGMEFYLQDGDSLRLLPWGFNVDTSSFFIRHQGEIGVLGFFPGQTTFSYVVDTVDYELFIKKEFYYRDDIFGKSGHQKK